MLHVITLQSGRDFQHLRNATHRAIIRALKRGDRVDGFDPFGHFAESRVLAIKVRCAAETNKELTARGIFVHGTRH